MSLLCEGYLIAAFKLYENPKFLQAISVVRLPAVNGTRNQPIIGVDQDPSLVLNDAWNHVRHKVKNLQWHQMDFANYSFFVESRERQAQKKAMELITTGFSVSTHHNEQQNFIQFMLMHQRFIKTFAAVRHTHPEIMKHKVGIIF